MTDDKCTPKDPKDLDNPDVIDLPQNVVDALKQAGMKDILFLAAVDSQGKMRFLKPTGVIYDEIFLSRENPICAYEVNQITFLRYVGSDCVACSQGGMGVKTFCPDPSGVF